jgi:hypothetical protein
MRVPIAVVFFSAIFASPALAQSALPPWEFGAGPHIVYRESTETTHGGGGVTVARRVGRFAVVLEAGGTRRDGHNDWRLVAGPRLTMAPDRPTSFFLQALAGTLIRSKEADWAVMPGGGIDVGLSGRRKLRFQIDAPIERSESRTATSVRASVWVLF